MTKSKHYIAFKHLLIHQAPTFCPLAPLHLLTLDSSLLFIHGLLDKCPPPPRQTRSSLGSAGSFAHVSSVSNCFVKL